MDKNGKDRIKELKLKLREKYLRQGLGELSESEKLRLVLSYSINGDMEEVADSLIEKYGSFTSIIDADSQSLEKHGGLDEKTVALLKIIPQLSRIYYMKEKKTSRLDTAEKAVKYFSKFFIGAAQEQLAVVCTDKKLNITAAKVVAKGSEVSINASFRDVAEFALLRKAECIFIAHNHPAGSAEASKSDLNATLYLAKNLSRLEITLIDHIIIGKNTGMSMRETESYSWDDGGSLFGYKLKTDSQV